MHPLRPPASSKTCGSAPRVANLAWPYAARRGGAGGPGHSWLENRLRARLTKSNSSDAPFPLPQTLQPNVGRLPAT
eukprot:3368117-Lingulodinium_polyedra.AAC.1